MVLKGLVRPLRLNSAPRQAVGAAEPSARYLELYQRVHEICAPGIPPSPRKIARKYIVFQCASALKKRTSGASTAEFGVFRGQTSMMISAILGREADAHHIFDSFAGLSEATPEDKLSRSTKGEMSPDIEAIRRLMPSATLHKVWIPEELPQEKFSFDLVHIDLDLYEPVSGALRFAYENRAPGAVIIVDDYAPNWEGCRQAVDEFVEMRADTLRWHFDTLLGNYVIICD